MYELLLIYNIIIIIIFVARNVLYSLLNDKYSFWSSPYKFEDEDFCCLFLFMMLVWEYSVVKSYAMSFN